MATLQELFDQDNYKLFKCEKGGPVEQLNHIDGSNAVMDSGAVYPLTDPGWNEVDPTPAGASELQVAKNNKLVELEIEFNKAMAIFTAGYPASEIASWDRQASQAHEFESNNSAPVGLIRRLAQRRAIALAELSLRIRKKEAAYEYGSGVLIGERQKKEDEVTLAADVAAVEAIEFSVPATFLADVQAEADSITS